MSYCICYIYDYFVLTLFQLLDGVTDNLTPEIQYTSL